MTAYVVTLACLKIMEVLTEKEEIWPKTKDASRGTYYRHYVDSLKTRGKRHTWSYTIETYCDYLNLSAIWQVFGVRQSSGISAACALLD